MDFVTGSQSVGGAGEEEGNGDDVGKHCDIYQTGFNIKGNGFQYQLCHLLVSTLIRQVATSFLFLKISAQLLMVVTEYNLNKILKAYCMNV